MPCSFSNRPNAGFDYCERATGGCSPDLLVAGVRVRFKSAETFIVQRNYIKAAASSSPSVQKRYYDRVSITSDLSNKRAFAECSGMSQKCRHCCKSRKSNDTKISRRLSLRRFHRCNGLWRRYDGRRSLLSETIHYVLFAQDEANLWTLPRCCVLPPEAAALADTSTRQYLGCWLSAEPATVSTPKPGNFS
jgi:hypothetical protein